MGWAVTALCWYWFECWFQPWFIIGAFCGGEKLSGISGADGCCDAMTSLYDGGSGCFSEAINSDYKFNVNVIKFTHFTRENSQTYFSMLSKQTPIDDWCFHAQHSRSVSFFLRSREHRWTTHDSMFMGEFIVWTTKLFLFLYWNLWILKSQIY